jgi:hypothetical protein
MTGLEKLTEEYRVARGRAASERASLERMRIEWDAARDRWLSAVSHVHDVRNRLTWSSMPQSIRDAIGEQ